MRLREARLREARLIGFQIGIEIHEPAITERGFKVYIYNLGNERVGSLGSDAQKGFIEKLSFELTPHGCGAFKFTTAGKPPFDYDYRYRVDIHPYFDATPWFSGFLTEIPEVNVGKPLVWKGFGFVEQLSWVLVSGDYQNVDIADIVKDLVGNQIAPYTQIIYNPAKVQNTGYTVKAVSFDKEAGNSAIRKLAETAQTFDYGVDMDREFFFLERNEDITIRFTVGKTAERARVKINPHSIRNRLYVKAGTIQSDGTNWVGVVEDTDSINAYGLREAVITAPQLLEGDDALQWANWVLSKRKDPQVSATVEGVVLDLYGRKIDANGKAELTLEDGTTYTLDIKRVRYDIDVKGITAKIDLGVLAIPFEENILEILRRIEEESKLADKRTKQLYS